MLGPWAVTISAVPVIVAVPIVFSLFTAASSPVVAFYEPKFRVLTLSSAVLLVAVISATLADRKHLEVPLLIPVLAFFNISALSAILSENVGHSFVGDRYDGLLSLAAGVLLFYATARFLDSRARARVFLAAGGATAVIVSIYGILQNFGLDPISSERGVDWQAGERAFSTVGHPIHLAAYLTLMMGATVALYFLTERRWERGLWLVALALVGACWLYTYTRGAMLGAGVALPVVLWLAHRRLGSIKPLLLPLAALATAMLVADLLSPQPASIADQLGSANFVFAYALVLAALGLGVALPVVLWLLVRRIGSARSLLLPLAALAAAMLVAFLLSPLSANVVNGFGEGAKPLVGSLTEDPQGSREVSVTTRFLIWRDAIPMILDRPLLGHGPDNFREPFLYYKGEELRALASATREYIDKAHNELLQVAATTGLLGLAAYLWILVAYFREAYRRGGWVLLALSGGVLAYIVQLQTAFTTIVTGVTFWAILGVSVAVMRIQDRENAKETAGEP